MIQGGGFDAQLRERPTRAPIAHEGRQAIERGGPRNTIGTIAMARTNDPNSATAQFYINVADNPNLDQPNARDGEGYAVFGKVIQGMDVVDKIKAAATGNKGGFANVPLQPIVIKKATLEK